MRTLAWRSGKFSRSEVAWFLGSSWLPMTLVVGVMAV